MMQFFEHTCFKDEPDSDPARAKYKMESGTQNRVSILLVFTGLAELEDKLKGDKFSAYFLGGKEKALVIQNNLNTNYINSS
jgi:hypothetical protein